MVYSLILDPDLSLGGTPEIEILDGATDKLELIDPTPDGGINLNKPRRSASPRRLLRFLPVGPTGKGREQL